MIFDTRVDQPWNAASLLDDEPSEGWPLLVCGTQECPFSPPYPSWPCGAHNARWRIRNRKTGQVMEGPGLIVHLIEAHGFFEGKESPYRVDPRALAELVELIDDRSGRESTSL